MGDGLSWDEALERLERFIATYPQTRALPGLQSIARRADLPIAFLREDERAHKVLFEALVDRPLSTLEAVIQTRTEVELLTFEVEVLTERLRETSDVAAYRRAAERLVAVRRRLTEIRSRL